MPLPAPLRPSFQAARKGRRAWWRRRLTASARPLPEFLIVGVAKGGTASLYSDLGQHPQVLWAFVKEVQFFDAYYERGVGWYRAHFPTAAERRAREAATGRPAVTGEASPQYLFDPLAPQRIAATLPEAKLIVLLRDPVARAYSHYHHRVRHGRIALTWEEALDYEAAHTPGELDPAPAEEGHRVEVHGMYDFRARGLYAEQLERLFRFVPRERVLVLKSEDLFADTQGAFDRVTAFLGLDPMELGAAAPKNQGRYERAVPREAELRAFFEPHNRRLYELLGRDLGW